MRELELRKGGAKEGERKERKEGSPDAGRKMPLPVSKGLMLLFSPQRSRLPHPWEPLSERSLSPPASSRSH